MEKTEKITTVGALRQDLLKAYQQLRAGKMEFKEAKQISLMANTIISSAKAQVKYNELTDPGKTIDFLEA